MSTTTGGRSWVTPAIDPGGVDGAEFLSTKHLCKTQKARAIGNWTDPSRHNQVRLTMEQSLPWWIKDQSESQKH